MELPPPCIYVDARCLQDGNYNTRGVGLHLTSLLRSRVDSGARRFNLVGLIDESLGQMPESNACLFDEVTRSRNFVLPARGSLFIHASPMTHDTQFSLRFARHPNLLSAAVVYDFIPLDWPGYLPTVSSRTRYLAQLARLRKCDLFLPISQYSARRLQEVLGVSATRIVVTGAAVRSSLAEQARQRRRRPSSAETPRYFLSVGGGDRRKNTELAVRAVQRVRLLTSDPVRLKVVGHYGTDYQEDLARIASELGDGSFLEFHAGVNDATLVDLYAGAIATIVPSHIEGFSLPVVEASLCGSPVIASTCAAHLELISQPDALFKSVDVDQLTDRLIPLLTDSARRAQLIEAQAQIGARFLESEVGARFWFAVLSEWTRRFPAPAPGMSFWKKPNLAILSPFSPDESGCARFTELTVQAAQAHFNIDLYTNARRPLSSTDGFRDAGPINAAAIAGRHDAVLSVIGNSHFHNEVFAFMERFGGPCILHDSRLTQIYYHRLGHEGFLELAERILGRVPSSEEVAAWVQDCDPASYFVEPILERATPLIVHTRRYQQLLEERYGFHAEVTTFPPTVSFRDEELCRAARQAARRRLGLQDGSFVVATFGYVTLTKGPVACVAALELLRCWNIPAELFCIGQCILPEETLRKVACDFGVAPHVHLSAGYVDTECYRDFLVASDAAIALRTYGFGQPSGALVDCISAALPTVASAELAATCEAPSYVRRIGDRISPLLIAEALAQIREQGMLREYLSAERSEYCRAHSFEQYAVRLKEILALS